MKSNEARLVLIEAVVGAAMSDGELNALEKRRVEQLLRFLRVDEAAKARLIGMMRAGRVTEPPPADDVPEYDVRLYIFEHAAMMAVADGRPNEHEMRYLRRMAELYDLDNADVRDALGRASETMPAE
ncbi:MAG: TerB family tellurite resistance protein [Deltaproteobacteria bacterium]|nr:TerB family tellurite resistance protein [Deltaproteobacteria bacterium]